MKYFSAILALFSMNSNAAILTSDLGIVFGGDLIPIGSSATKLPVSQSQEFSTSEDNQNAVVIHIGQKRDQGISAMIFPPR